ncbi:MAG: V-type ATPase 116kDa subunit family protein, partial [Calditrichaeota bacterium]|nr:V-type ATPase 116kDa subunit family protein [Calditrichota bacterium]
MNTYSSMAALEFGFKKLIKREKNEIIDRYLIVTLLSGFMIYAGYIYHPIIHRIGNDLGQKFQTEFVPVEQKNAPLTHTTKPVQLKKDILTEEKDETLAEQGKDTTQQTDASTNLVEPKPVSISELPPLRRRESPATTWSNQRRKPHKRNTQTQKPPRFDLLTAIKKGVKVSDPSKYFISDRDRELGREIQKLENDFEQQYA